MMIKVRLSGCISAVMSSIVLVGCIQNSQVGQLQKSQLYERPSSCKVNETIERKAVPQTPNQMSLPSFGQGVIGWATGPEGAQARLESVSKQDIHQFKAQGVSLEMIREWQGFYTHEAKRNPCNPTAPLRAQLMEKIASLWMD